MERRQTGQRAEVGAHFFRVEPWARRIENVGDYDGDGLEDLIVLGAVPMREAIELVTEDTVKGVTWRVRGESFPQFDVMRSVTRLGELGGSDAAEFALGVAIDYVGDCGVRGEVRTFSDAREPRVFERPPPAGRWLCGDDYALDLADAGDVDNDGVRDIVVASLGPDAGSYVLSGRDGARIRKLPVDGSVAVAGRDLDGDGVADFALANVLPTSRFAVGVVWILPGDTTRAPAYLSSPIANSRFGHALAFLDDLDGDGAVELAVSAPEADEERGAVYVFSGATRALLRTWSGREPGVCFGSSLCADHDLDGDGIRELVVGSPGYLHADAVRSVCVIEPLAGRVLLEIDGGAARAQGDPIPVEYDYYSEGLRTLPADYAFGWSVATAQLDGDGLPELVIGAPQWGPNRCVGRLYAVSGAFVRRCIESAR